jgi:hypothetical protein
VPVISNVDEAHHLATLVLSGNCDYPSTRAGILDLASDDGGDGDVSILVDFRDTAYVPNSVEALEIADVIAQPTRLLHHKVALVAEEESQLRVVSIIAALCSLRGGEARSFRDVGAALGWLRGRPDGFFPRASRSSRHGPSR